MLQNFSYDDISELSEDEVEILEALMGRLWSLIDDEDDVPALTNIGHQFCEKNGGLDDGVLIANDFDGTDLEGIVFDGGRYLSTKLYFELGLKLPTIRHFTNSGLQLRENGGLDDVLIANDFDGANGSYLKRPKRLGLPFRHQ